MLIEKPEKHDPTTVGFITTVTVTVRTQYGSIAVVSTILPSLLSTLKYYAS